MLLRRLFETLGRDEFVRVVRTLNYESCLDTYLLLMENPRHLWRATDIAEELGVSKATAYRVVDLLTSVKLIKIVGKIKDKGAFGPPPRLYCYNDLDSVQPRASDPKK